MPSERQPKTGSSEPLTMQAALFALQNYWGEHGCIVAQPFNTEVGAGTMNPATVLRVLGPEPWQVAYVEPSVRPDDSRYGENPNRLQTHTQFQVILKPDPGNPQELYLGSLKALGIDTTAHDVRFVEDNWAQPAIGAWGLGWEVWLDGMEVTQFTYFQQVGGQNLDPVSVEITYGMERILMAQQQVTHFRDIAYAPGITYGEVFGQSEYEMSRYYLDEADIATNRQFFAEYTKEAARLIESRLPLPAHTYVLKSSHAFNVLDSRGAISTTERAAAFSKMSRLARKVAQLWVERREEIGYPLLPKTSAIPHRLVPEKRLAVAETNRETSAVDSLDVADFVLEIGCEELPPHVLRASLQNLEKAAQEYLSGTRLAHEKITVTGTPRRLILEVAAVAARELDTEMLRKGPKIAAAYDASGQATKALQGFARSQGVSPEAVGTAVFNGVEHVVIAQTQKGRSAQKVLGTLVETIVTGLNSDKNMRWADENLSFSRPIRWLLALWGQEIVPAEVSLLETGATTYLLRNDSEPFRAVPTASSLQEILTESGIITCPATRKDVIVAQAQKLAAGVDGTIDLVAEAALIEEITGLVEAPYAIIGDFDPRYLEVPEHILTTVMRKHQRYLPVRDQAGELLPHYVTIANGKVNPEVVQAGNNSVLRARYDDAAFFWEADLQVPLATFQDKLSALTFENTLGSFASRAERINSLSQKLAAKVELTAADQKTLQRAGEIAKFDLSTQMVIEFSSLAGFMAQEYALRAGETLEVAQSLAEMESPRTSEDSLPTLLPGALLAAADRFDLLVSMFSVGAKPTGSSDPYALRRAALGLVRILRDRPEIPWSISRGVAAAATQLRAQDHEVTNSALAAAADFITGRFSQLLRDEGNSADEVQAVSALLNEPAELAVLLESLHEVQNGSEQELFHQLTQSMVRISRILGTEETTPVIDIDLLQEPAERAVIAAWNECGKPGADETLTAWTQRLAPMLPALDAFFDEVLVNAEDAQVRSARRNLLAAVLTAAPRGLHLESC